MEYATAHGYLMATVKDYAAKRVRQRHRDAPSEDWVAGLSALSGVPVPAPADSPVAGMTTATFRSSVAAMRAAERERMSGPH